MQLLNSDEPASETRSHPEKPQEESSSPATDSSDSTTDEGVALDVSGKSLEFSAVDEETAEDSAAESLYLYRNVYSLVPKWVGGLARLKTLKFFGNEVNLFAPEFRGMTALECLQMKISSPGIGGLPLHKLNGLKELELSRGPPRPSAFPLLAEIAALKRLTKLSICHFSIRYLPPEIGCLKNLEYLDLSFNKLKTLPSEISCLNSLITMKVANNKLVELPSTMTSLTRLESLDLSNNRLTSLGSIELGSMCRLQLLNLQYNKLLSVFHIPSWICCKLEGNDGGGCNDDCSSSSVEMDVYESSQQENDRTISNGAHNTSSSTLTSTSSSSRCFSARKSGKRWKRRFYLQQKARQERLNNSRKWKVVDQDQLLSNNIQIISESGNIAAASCKETVSDHVNLDDNGKKIFSEKEVNDNLSGNNKDEVILEKQFSSDNCHTAECKDERDASLNGPGEQDEQSLEILKCFSTKSKFSICGIEDHLSDGFYDAGRDRPFMPLESYEQNQCLDSREVILLDRKRDEELDAVLPSAQALVTNLKKLNGLNTRGMHAVVDSLQTASLLALFVSDHFGGSDRSAMVERTRKSVSGSNYNKPFVCTCSAGSSTSMTSSKKPAVNTIEDITLSRISEQCIDSIKKRRSSIIVPIGSVQYGVCRHRALLLKYLCDHMVPAVPCELVRGYLDFSPHAWNIILIKRGDTWVRMLVDACRPHDIREEKDPEYFCRYVPLSRATIPLSSRGSHGPDCLFPSLSTCDELKKKASTTLVQCKIGSVEAAAKVRTLDVQGSSAAEIRNFDYNCLGEVRILGSLKHPCIVEMYGHEISCQWTFTADGKPHNRILRSAIFMETIWKSYQKLVKSMSLWSWRCISPEMSPLPCQSCTQST
ncbi:hypothetical protein AAHE18_09G168900 [Arachis hypogaea]